MATVETKSFYQFGNSSLAVPLSLHTINRRRLCERLTDNKAVPKGAMILLQGGEQHQRYCTDVDAVFRQESFFHWTFGVLEAGCLGAVEVESTCAILFFPKPPPGYHKWIGVRNSLEHFRKRYEVEEVYYTNQIADVLQKKNPSVILTLKGVNTDSRHICNEATFENINKFHVDNTILHPEISECRVFKTAQELEVIRYANKISSKAHKEVMKRIRPGMSTYQLESLFQHYCFYHGGCRHLAYNCLMASGVDCACPSHTVEVDSKVIRDGDILFDMGCEYYCYASDITCSFPANGKFTDDQRMIYEICLRANRAVMIAIKPGVSWADMHRLANRVQLEGLRDIGLLQGDINEMMRLHVGAVFMPYGLGHLMGLDVHDVGGYPKGTERINEPGLCSLRTTRVLEEGMVLTIEPGIHFIRGVIEEALENPETACFFNREVLNRLWNVHIEDDIVVTSEGVELLTDVPRTVDEIEALMAQESQGSN
ncbi:hypothetical protein pdam_00002560 [Pocillopora damicornis]|uniref:Xaa-Pro dipeptidase n=1 Tax=Pocillopora damicornis TaxID=46731 RepID=A0A3M6TS04_POCDA|nr:hypothetical protein pdam_00002560 [Pocillopora damicornis]